jgi:hypothetical protein
VQLIAGVFMGIKMLGLLQGSAGTSSVGTTLRRFIPHMPRIFARKIDE